MFQSMHGEGPATTVVMVTMTKKMLHAKMAEGSGVEEEAVRIEMEINTSATATHCQTLRDITNAPYYK